MCGLAGLALCSLLRHPRQPTYLAAHFPSHIRQNGVAGLVRCGGPAAAARPCWQGWSHLPLAPPQWPQVTAQKPKGRVAVFQGTGSPGNIHACPHCP